jgi:multidrug efflux pump subunit AcrB
VAHVFTPFLSKALYWRYISLCIAVSILLLTIGLIKGGILKFEVFPEVDGFIMTSTVEFPSATPLDVTKQTIEQIDAALLRISENIQTCSGDPLIEDRMALIGQTMEGIPRSGPHLGSVWAILLDSERRGVHSKNLMIQWEKEIGAIPGVKSLTFAGFGAGPQGAPIEVWLQGEQKKIRESFDSLFVGYPLAILGIFIIIATMFRSYAQSFVILFTIPFGIIGAVIGHLLLGLNLSIMSIFGIVALTGVVVNDAIVLIERVNENIAEGMSFFDAILGGGARRFRAIFLTSLSTVGGLTPLIMETDFQAKFLIPMALSIAAGTAFATVLTLVLVPSLMALLSDARLLVHRLKYGFWPKRVDVEPARDRHLDPLADEPALETRPIIT